MRDAFRSGALVGLVSALPVLVWWTAQDLSFSPASPLGQSPLAIGVRALWVVQAVGLPLFGLTHCADASGGAALAQPIYAVWVPLPLYVLPLLSGVLAPLALAKGLFSLSAYGAGLAAIGWALSKIRWNREALFRARSSALLLVAVLAWTHRDSWLAWLSR